jgi:hypothetical protein
MDAYAPPSAPTVVRPRAILWYRAYATFMLFLAIAFALLAATLMYWVKTDGLVVMSGEDTSTRDATMLVVASSAVLVFYAIATFVPFKPWGWTVGLVAIAFGAATPLIVVALPLFFAWNKPLVKAAFRRI